jgi:hypothetical protein
LFHNVSFVVAGLLLAATTAYAVPAWVQSGYEECGPCTSLVVDFTFPDDKPGSENVTAGNAIVVTVRTDNTNGPVNSVTSQPGSQTGTMKKRETMLGFWLEVWCIPNATGGATTVTVNNSGAPDSLRVVLDEYSGFDSTCALAGTPVSGTGTGSTTNAGNITTTLANSLIHVGVGSDGVGAENATAGSGYTLHFLGSSPTGSDKTRTEDRVTATAGSYGTTMTINSDSWAAVAVAFAASGGDTTPPAAPTGVSVQ